MKKFASYLIYTILLACIACACNDNLVVQQNYDFTVSHLPVKSKLSEGETAEIRFQLHREGFFEETKYYVRYFQTDGYGTLKMADGTVLLPNDLYELPGDIFRMYYISQCSDQQKVDLYFEDNHGRVVPVSFSFTNEEEMKEPEDV